MFISIPQPGEYAPYAKLYIDYVPLDTNLIDVLHQQSAELLSILQSLSEQMLVYRYEPGKWCIKDILVHIIDVERVSTYRAFCIARGEQKELPGFDQNAYVEEAKGELRTIDSLIHEYRTLRESTIALLQNFTDTEVLRFGRANGNPVSVRALIYQIAGHEKHHIEIIKQKYLTKGDLKSE